MNSPEEKRYVVGFMFSPNLENVVLIEKKRPDWQAGKCNGVGGGIEKTDLTAVDAMRREFREETGLDHEDWRYFASLKDQRGYTVLFYYAVSDVYMQVETVTDEKVFLVHVEEGVLAQNSSWPMASSNVRWLIVMARSLASGAEKRAKSFSIVENE